MRHSRVRESRFPPIGSLPDGILFRIMLSPTNADRVCSQTMLEQAPSGVGVTAMFRGLPRLDGSVDVGKQPAVLGMERELPD